MRGLDPAFRDLPDYIGRITREIWEDRGIGRSIGRYYPPDVIVRAANALIVGGDGIAGATLQTLHEFPDRQLVNEDVIWTGDDDGYLSSHRLISVMRKQGDGAYGPARGQLVRSRIIADCVVRENAIREEWLVRDHAAFAYAVGDTPEAMARRLAAEDVARTGQVVVFNPARDVPSAWTPVLSDEPAARLYADAWREIWGTKTPAAIRDAYAEGIAATVAGNETLSGHADLDRFVISYLASFPDAAFRVEHLIVNREAERPVRLAMRWSLDGTHAGWGRFGAPTGAPVHVMGMTHAFMGAGRITHEWILTDEIAIWKQIAAHAMGRSGA